MNNPFQFLMYRSVDEEVSVKAIIKDETIWLTQKGMAELFDVKVPAISKHLKNILPVILGVIVSSIFTVWTLDEPNTLLAALFATGLAPIAGQFGWGWGMLAGAIHASVVLNTGFLHGGLNLYNNGFSAGLVCIVLVPLIESLRKET